MLTVKDLSKKYKGKIVVDHVSFTLPEQECIALIGPNGAGKTTTLRMMIGAIKKSTGNISLEHVPKKDIRSYIGYLPQHPVFYPWMSGEQYLHHCAQLFCLNNIEEKVDHVLQTVQLEQDKKKKIGAYSGGMKQRLGIAQAIIHEPKLLILDEPVSALDPIGRRDVLQLMEKLKENMTILFSTHILHDAEEISDQLILMQNGQIVESGSLAELQKRYFTEQIEIQFQNLNEHMLDTIHSFAYVDNLEIDGKKLIISTANKENIIKNILRYCVQEEIVVEHLTSKKISLEQLFMKVMQ